MMVHVRAAPTACASREPHEPEHQAPAGSLLIYVLQHIQGVYRIYTTSPEFHSWQILFPSNPVIQRDRI